MFISPLFVADPPLVKQSGQGEPTAKGVTEAAVWDAWVSRSPSLSSLNHRLHLLLEVLFTL